MKRMLINATQPEELRVALVDGQRLYDLDIESANREQKKANIYRGKITRVEPSLEAAFVDFGAGRHGFLPLKAISREYFMTPPAQSRGRVNIKEVIKEGQELIVQVEKDERGNKGAALTTFISLAGRFLVLMPNNPRAGGISRRIEGEERDELKSILSQLTIPEETGVIVRTAGVGKSIEELQWDLDYLLQLWEAISKAALENRAPFLVYQESDLVIRAIRDNLRKDISEVLIDDEKIHQEACQFISQVMPDYTSKVKLYKDEVPLFNRYHIESQIEIAFLREVKLPSGGSIVIDPTEALVSIDINSARATKGTNIEDTALRTNLEASDEIARQLRLRDMGGLVVIDFIDMTSNKNQREVENQLRNALKLDRARIQIGRISRFGLMEMSRQRLRPSLGETTTIVCPRCNGHGSIRGVESLALSVMRLIEEEAFKERTAQVHAILPVPVATFLLNEKREVVTDIEKRQGVTIVIVPNPNMETPHFEVQRIRSDDEIVRTTDSSYGLVQEDTLETTAPKHSASKKLEAAVKTVEPSRPAPSAPRAEAPSKPGAIKRLIKSLFSPDTTPEKPVAEEKISEPVRKPVRTRGASSSSNEAKSDKENKPRQQQRRPTENDRRKVDTRTEKSTRNRKGSRDNTEITSETAPGGNKIASETAPRNRTGKRSPQKRDRNRSQQDAVIKQPPSASKTAEPQSVENNSTAGEESNLKNRSARDQKPRSRKPSSPSTQGKNEKTASIQATEEPIQAVTGKSETASPQPRVDISPTTNNTEPAISQEASMPKTTVPTQVLSAKPVAEKPQDTMVVSDDVKSAPVAAQDAPIETAKPSIQEKTTLDSKQTETEIVKSVPEKAARKPASPSSAKEKKPATAVATEEAVQPKTKQKSEEPRQSTPKRASNDPRERKRQKQLAQKKALQQQEQQAPQQQTLKIETVEKQPTVKPHQPEDSKPTPDQEQAPTAVVKTKETAKDLEDSTTVAVTPPKAAPLADSDEKPKRKKPTTKTPPVVSSDEDALKNPDPKS